MFKKLAATTAKKLYFNILSSKITYFVLLIIILIQFILVSIIFLQNKKSKYLTEQTNFKAAAIENQQNKINEKLNGLQTQIMRMSSRLYRMNQE